ncbi:MAG: glycosyltransferase family 4 protein [Sedimentisphaerales bacterium]|nr:glycosyltransferase family 4 protein [Sedimentisphaerales bacterium]
MMRVAIIIERADVSLGGAERSVLELAGQLSTLGLEVTILAAKGSMDAENVQVLCPKRRGKRTPLPAFDKALQQHFVAHRYDIIHSTLPFGFADVYQPRGGSYREAMLQNAASYEHPILAFTKRRLHWINRKRTAMLRAERILCRRDETIVAALSDYVKRKFQQHYGLPDERIAVIPNGVRIRSQIDEKAVDQLRARVLREMNLQEVHQPALYLFAANNFRLKGLGPLLEALVMVRKSIDRPVCVLVAGSGNIRPYLRLAGKFGLSDRIAFLGKIHPIQHALAVADAAVLPTWYDPSSRFILEALAAGTPVITTRYNGAAEMYTDGRHGITLERPDDIERLAEAMAFYSDPENVELAREAILTDRLIDEVSLARHGQQLIDLYENILRARGLRR